MKTVLAIAAAALIAAGCATPKPPPPVPTETTVRARFNAAHASVALAKIDNAATRTALERHFAERAARTARGVRLALDDVRLGERITIGSTVMLERVFALYHEHDEARFITYLEGIELVTGRVQNAFREPVGGSGRGLAEIELVELNRVILRRYVAKTGDQPCCPTQLEASGFALTPSALEPLR